MKKVEISLAEEVLLEATSHITVPNDNISNSIDEILRGPHKTYRYVLITAILAKSTNDEIDILSLQAGDDSEGAYDARSLCHKVIVPFERNYYPNSLGGSNEPYLNKPARFPRISLDNAVRKGNDYRTLSKMIEILSEISSSEQARIYLCKALWTLSDIYNSIEEKFNIDEIEIDQSSNPQTLLDFICELTESSFEGEICPLVVSAIEHYYYNGERKVIAHKVNESGASSKEIGDIDIFDSAEILISSIEVKDKDFTKEDVEHAINKFRLANLRNTMFIYGKNVSYKKREVFKTSQRLGNNGYFCVVISIIDFAKIRLYSMKQPIELIDFVNTLLLYAKQINAKDETLNWIKRTVGLMSL